MKAESVTYNYKNSLHEGRVSTIQLQKLTTLEQSQYYTTIKTRYTKAESVLYNYKNSLHESRVSTIQL